MPRKTYITVGYIALVSALLAVALSALFPRGNFDMDSYHIVADITARGGNVYAETERYNYSPLWASVLFGVHSFSTSSGMSFSLGVGMLLAVAHVCLTVLVAAVSNAAYPGTAIRAASAYALNPGVIFVIGYHRQFEVLALIVFLIAVLLAPRLRFWQLGALLVVAIVVKHNIALLVWVYVASVYGYRRALLVGMSSVVALLLTLVPYASSPEIADAIIRHVLLYTSAMNNGFGLAVWLPRIFSIGCVVVALLVTPYWIGRQNWSLTVVFVMLVCFVSGIFASQYFILLAVAVALGGYYRRWLLVSGLCLALDYIFGHFMGGYRVMAFAQTISIIALWSILALWLVVAGVPLLMRRGALYPRVWRARSTDLRTAAAD